MNILTCLTFLPLAFPVEPLLMPSDGIPTQISLSKCVLQIADTIFSDRQQTILYSLPIVNYSPESPFLTTSNTIVKALVETNIWNMLVYKLKNSDLKFGNYDKPKAILIQFRKRNEILEIFNRLSDFSFGSPRNRFLIFSSNLFQDPKYIATEIWQYLLKKNINYIAVILANPQNTTNFNVYTWSRRCGNTLKDTTIVNSCYFGQISNKSILSFASFGDLHNCEVKVMYKKWPPFVIDILEASHSGFTKSLGTEINVVNVIASHLNLSIKYFENRYIERGDVYVNGTVTNEFELLKNNTVDVLVGGYAQTPTRLQLFDCTSSFIRDNFIWLVSSGNSSRDLLAFVKIFDLKIWIYLTALYIIISLMVMLFSLRSKNELIQYKTAYNVFQNSLMIALCFPVAVLPKTKTVRCCFLILVLLGSYINSIYTSKLTSSLSVLYYKEEVNDMEALYKHNYKTLFLAGFQRFFDKNDSTAINGVEISTILERWSECRDVIPCIRQVTEQANTAYCIGRPMMEYYYKNREIDFKRNSARMIYQNVVVLPMNIITRKGFFLYQVFENIIRRIEEAGLLTKFQRDIAGNRQSVWIRRDTTTSDITLNNLMPIIKAVFAVYAIANLVFLLECLHHRYKTYLKESSV